MCGQFVLNLPEGKKYRVLIEEANPKRSLEQNNRYWAILSDIAQQVPDETGKRYSAEVWHEYMKEQFLGKDTILIDGEVKFVQKSTTTLKVMEFADYMTKCEAWGAERGVVFFNDAA